MKIHCVLFYCFVYDLHRQNQSITFHEILMPHFQSFPLHINFHMNFNSAEGL